MADGPAATAPLRGHCLCGVVRYVSSGPPRGMWYCHCRCCAKTSGAGFGTWVAVPDVVWESGERQRARFVAAAGFVRSFCHTCGSQLPSERRNGGEAMFPAGGLDSVDDLQPGYHAFTSQRAAWLPACHALAGNSDARNEPAQSCRAESASPCEADLPVSGSCFCGTVAFTALSLYAMRVCHCSRCRRRSGSSCFVGLTCRTSGLTTARGEPAVRSWRLPGSVRYVVRFCAVCGCPVPSIVRDIAFVPAGSLDSDPGVRARCHVYFDSRASWTRIADHLPRFGQMPPPDFDWHAGRPRPV